MKRQHPLFSPIGCGAALLLLGFMLVSVLIAGGTLFLPGPVSASAPRGRMLDGVASHADFESNCEQCHIPWQGASDVRCLNCHSDIEAQETMVSGVHGVMPAGHVCTECHGEHQGSEFSSLLAAREHFNHDWTGYHLLQHAYDYDGSVMVCADCHESADYAFSEETCARCHSAADPVYISQHVNEVGTGCLTCHTGQGVEAFDHSFFPLKGGHAGLTCSGCHSGQTFTDASVECAACHAEPDLHLGQFGTDCGVCHIIDNWHDVRLIEHSFPLEHEQDDRRPIACEVCHPVNYVTYTCYSSGCHSEPEIREEHVNEGIVPFDDCMDCHADGSKHEGEDSDD